MKDPPTPVPVADYSPGGNPKASWQIWENSGNWNPWCHCAHLPPSCLPCCPLHPGRARGSCLEGELFMLIPHHTPPHTDHFHHDQRTRVTW